MRVHELTNRKKQIGVIFEITSLETTKVARYARPYGEYIEDEILREVIHLEDYILPNESKRERISSLRTLVRRAAMDICPFEEVVFFEDMVP